MLLQWKMPYKIYMASYWLPLFTTPTTYQRRKHLVQSPKQCSCLFARDSTHVFGAFHLVHKGGNDHPIDSTEHVSTMYKAFFIRAHRSEIFGDHGFHTFVKVCNFFCDTLFSSTSYVDEHELIVWRLEEHVCAGMCLSKTFHSAFEVLWFVKHLEKRTKAIFFKIVEIFLIVLICTKTISWEILYMIIKKISMIIIIAILYEKKKYQ